MGCLSLMLRPAIILLRRLNTEEKLFDEIYKFMPSELICNEAFFMSGMNIEDLKNRLGITIYSLDPWYFDDAICTGYIERAFPCRIIGLGLVLQIMTVGLLLPVHCSSYLKETQKTCSFPYVHV